VVDDSRRPPDLVAAGLAGLIEGIRDDVREDIRDLRTDLRGEMARSEDRMTTRVIAMEQHQTATHALLSDYAKSHGDQHEAEAVERRREHGAFYDFIRRQELDEARRDGALGVARYGIELLSKHGTNIAKVIIAVAGLVLAASGELHVAVGA
jgi:hypothetical protein